MRMCISDVSENPEFRIGSKLMLMTSVLYFLPNNSVNAFENTSAICNVVTSCMGRLVAIANPFT
jgi:hypothetical protein